MARTPFAPQVIPSAATVLHFGSEQRVRAYKPLRLGASSERAALGQQTRAAVDPLTAAFESAKAAGLAQGREEGHEAGRAEAEREAAEMRAHLQQSTRELAGLRSVLTEAYRRELVELALCAAESAMGRPLPEGAPMVHGLIEEALAAMHGVDSFVVRVPSADLDAVRAWTVREGLDGIDVVDDASLHPGDFKLQCAQGSVEAIMSDRLDRVRRLVLGQIEEGSTP